MIRVDNIPENAGYSFLRQNEDPPPQVYFIPAFSQPIIFAAGTYDSASQNQYSSYIAGTYWNSKVQSDGGLGVLSGDISSAFNYLQIYGVSKTQGEIDIINNYAIDGYEPVASYTANSRIYVNGSSIAYDSNTVDSNGIISPTPPIPESISFSNYSSLFPISTAIYVFYEKKVKPTYYDLLGGFKKDKRLIPPRNIRINSTEDINIGYYKINTLEPIPNLKSIDWVERKILAGINIKLDLTGCVLGTLVSDKPINFPTTRYNQYSYNDFLYQNVDALFNYWKSIKNVIDFPSELKLLAANNNVWQTNSTIYNDINYDINHPLFKIENQRAYDWHVKPQLNGSKGNLTMDSPRTIEIHAALEAAKYKAEVPAIIGTGTVDNPQIPAIHTLGYSIANGGGEKLDDIHQALEAKKYKTEVPAVIGTGTADNPQTPAIRTLGYSIANGGGKKLDDIHKALEAAKYLEEVPAVIGLGTADNPQIPAIHTLGYSISNGGSKKIDQIHKALDADKYSIDLSTNQPRVATLAWHINRQSEILGIRVKANGLIDVQAEKTANIRTHVDGSSANNELEFNPNCFGSQGMLIRHLPNKFSVNGTQPGGYRQVKDIPQLLAELHEQANSAMGYQEGTAIEIQLDGEIYRYPNQLALLTELFVTAKQTATYSKGAFFSSVIGEQSIKEVMAGLGLRTVDKFLEFTVAKKSVKLYYKGISASQSIRRKLSAITTNIGIAIGNII